MNAALEMVQLDTLAFFTQHCEVLWALHDATEKKVL